jgi:hypothetical protein
MEPSMAIRRAASLPSSQFDGGWCIGIVADAKTSTDLVGKACLRSNREICDEKVHFLSIRDQQKMTAEKSGMGKFIEAIPYNHLARKNTGYLYAIQQGATLILGMDDEHVLKLDTEGKVISPFPYLSHLDAARIAMAGNKLAFNHHPSMGASGGNTSWARGFPLSRIQDEATHGMVAYGIENMTFSDLAVLQICNTGDPDSDAIHRRTKSSPVTFVETSTTNTPLVVPSRTFAPYHAQATIHTQQAHWALLLLSTVPAEVSYIWRSYFAPAIYRHLKLQIAFLPPRGVRDRRTHSIPEAVSAESTLYFKTERFA